MGTFSINKFRIKSCHSRAIFYVHVNIAIELADQAVVLIFFFKHDKWFLLAYYEHFWGEFILFPCVSIDRFHCSCCFWTVCGSWWSSTPQDSLSPRHTWSLCGTVYIWGSLRRSCSTAAISAPATTLTRGGSSDCTCPPPGTGMSSSVTMISRSLIIRCILWKQIQTLLTHWRKQNLSSYLYVVKRPLRRYIHWNYRTWKAQKCVQKEQKRRKRDTAWPP